MGCPTEVEIGDNLVFSVTTHDPNTGVLTDADAVPTYRVYEDETSTPILTGVLAKLEDANTTGFYTELIACTIGNGFEDAKTYTIYIEATVDGDTGGKCYGFKAYTVRIAASNAGAGSQEETLTIKDNSGNPISGAETWVSTDEAGTNIVTATINTDDFGQVTFFLDPGTYWLWADDAGHRFSPNPQEIVVS